MLAKSLIATDKQIWICEIDIQDTKELNARYPDRPLDTVNELLEHTKKYRQEIAAIIADYRKTIHSKREQFSIRSPRH